MSSAFDKTLGESVKRLFRLPNTATAGDSFDYWVDTGCNDRFGEIKENGTLNRLEKTHTDLFSAPGIHHLL